MKHKYKLKKNKKIKFESHNKSTFFDKLIKSSGITIKKRELIKLINISSLTFAFIEVILILLIYRKIQNNILWFIFIILICTLISWSLVFFGVVITFQLVASKRTKDIETHLANFLELASNNISAGMSIDKALWFAVRPNFGILSKEIEIVAKKVMNGYDLVTALEEFSNKYNSAVLKRSILLLVEGLKAGGNVGDLLNKIADNITQTNILKKQTSASVMSYVIFILFASVVISPILFALGGQIIKILAKMMVHVGSIKGSNLNLPFKFSKSIGSTNFTNFNIFAYISMGIGSFFTALIISNMTKGDSDDAIKLFPIYLITSYLLYFGSSYVLKIIFSFFF